MKELLILIGISFTILNLLTNSFSSNKNYTSEDSYKILRNTSATTVPAKVDYSSTSHSTNDPSNSTSGDHSSGEHHLLGVPIYVDDHNGALDYENMIPTVFSCHTVHNPQETQDCSSKSINATDPANPINGIKCCFVETLEKGFPIQNFCIPLNESNLPAKNFMVTNRTSETISTYDCGSLILNLSWSIPFLIYILII